MNHNVLNPECPQNNGSTAVCLCQTFIQKLTNIPRHQDPAPKMNQIKHICCRHCGSTGHAPDVCCQEPKKCGYMILTPTPLHNGGMWCAEEKPCKWHNIIEPETVTTIFQDPAPKESLREEWTELKSILDNYMPNEGIRNLLMKRWKNKLAETYEEGYVARGAVESAQKQRMFEAGKVLGRKEEGEMILRWVEVRKNFFDQELTGATDSSYYAEGCVKTIEDLLAFLKKNEKPN